MEKWRGKVAVITGASAGIGANVAQKLVEEGLQVVGFARRLERVTELAEKLQGREGQLHPLKVDITQEEEIVEAFKWVTENLGPVHILINNAGIAHNTTLIDGDASKWRAVCDTNILGLCITTREALAVMRTHEVPGHIIHVNSVAGHKVPNVPNMNIYSATKHAVTALTETLRLELMHMSSKIKISSVSPGAVNTEFMDAGNFSPEPGFFENHPEMPHLNQEDITEAILYILGTKPHVQVHDIIIKPIGENFI